MIQNALRRYLYDKIKEVVAKDQRVLVTVLTKKMAQELSSYYNDLGLKCQYMHSDLDAIERNQIIRGLRVGEFDVLIGINLLREGLDLPEVSLVAILDADKEGFLRSTTALIQTAGRAARNAEGKVLMYAQKITPSMKETIDTTKQRRQRQIEYNKKHNITPKTTIRELDTNLKLEDSGELYNKKSKLEKMPKSQRQQLIKELKAKMLEASKKLEFEEAARLRDEIAKIKKL
jgi:excinuclease ABC subunit B